MYLYCFLSHPYQALPIACLTTALLDVAKSKVDMEATHTLEVTLF